MPKQRALVGWRITTFLAGLGVILTLLSIAFDRVLPRNFAEKVNWIFAKRGGAYTFAILGSSRGLNSSDVPSVERHLGGPGINLSLAGRGYEEQSLVLDYFLAHNRARYLLLQVDAFGLDNTAFKMPFGDYAYFPYFGDTVVRRHLRKRSAIRFAMWRYVPFLKYAEFNGQSGVGQIWGALTHRTPEFDSAGTQLLPAGFHGDPSHVAAYSTRINLERVHALEDILATARAHGSEVVFYVAPEMFIAQRAAVDRSRVFQFYDSVANASSAQLYVFDNLPMNADTSFFWDSEHVNRRGALVFSDSLGRLLRARLFAGNATAAPAR